MTKTSLSLTLTEAKPRQLDPEVFLTLLCLECPVEYCCLHSEPYPPSLPEKRPNSKMKNRGAQELCYNCDSCGSSVAARWSSLPGTWQWRKSSLRRSPSSWITGKTKAWFLGQWYKCKVTSLPWDDLGLPEAIFFLILLLSYPRYF